MHANNKNSWGIKRTINSLACLDTHSRWLQPPAPEISIQIPRVQFHTLPNKRTASLLHLLYLLSRSCMSGECWRTATFKFCMLKKIIKFLVLRVIEITPETLMHALAKTTPFAAFNSNASHHLPPAFRIPPPPVCGVYAPFLTFHSLSRYKSW